MILCFGEISWDRLVLVNKFPEPGRQAFVNKEKSLPGGCTLNTAVHLALIGEKVLLGGNDIGSDNYGKKIKEKLERLGIIFLSKESSHKTTPICDVLIDEKTKERSFILHHTGIQDFSPDMFDGIDINKIDVAFVDTYLKESSYALLELLQNRPIKIWLQDLEANDPRIALGDIVQISLDESLCLDHEKIKSVASRYFRGRCATVVLTVGGEGAFLVRSNGEFIYEKLPSQPERSAGSPIVDTTGCGDAFRAGGMVAWRDNKSWRDILLAGIERGALQATIFGSNPI